MHYIEATFTFARAMIALIAAMGGWAFLDWKTLEPRRKAKLVRAVADLQSKGKLIIAENIATIEDHMSTALFFTAGQSAEAFYFDDGGDFELDYDLKNFWKSLDRRNMETRKELVLVAAGIDPNHIPGAKGDLIVHLTSGMILRELKRRKLH